MNKQYLLIILAAGAVLGALFFLGKSSGGVAAAPVVSAGASMLSVVEQEFDFGSIAMANGNVSHRFMVKNTGDAAATITSLYTSCMCTSATIIKGDERLGPFGMQGHGFIPRINMMLAPQEEAEVLVTFDPAAHGPAGVGTIARTVYVETDGRDPLTLGIAATVTP